MKENEKRARRIRDGGRDRERMARTSLPSPASVWSILIYRYCQAPNNGRGKGDGLRTGSYPGVASGKSRCPSQEHPGKGGLRFYNHGFHSAHPPEDSGRTEFLQEDPACASWDEQGSNVIGLCRPPRCARGAHKNLGRTDKNQALINAVQSQHAVAIPAMGAVCPDRLLRYRI